jgi:hypothetical protein
MLDKDSHLKFAPPAPALLRAKPAVIHAGVLINVINSSTSEGMVSVIGMSQDSERNNLPGWIEGTI